MLERVLPYNLVVNYKPGTRMGLSNRVKSINVKDHSLTKLAELGREDVMYCRMIDHLKRGTSHNMIEEECELSKLRGDIQNIGLFNT